MSTDSHRSRTDRTSRRTTTRPRSADVSMPWQRVALLVVACAAAIVITAVVVDAASSAGRVHPGVTVGTVKIGGMNPETAAAELERELPAMATKPVVLDYESKSWTVKPDAIAVTFDYPALVNQAMSVGRSGTASRSLLQRIAAWSGRADLPAPVVADQEKLRTLLDTVADDVDVAPEDARVEIKGTKTSVIPSTDGVSIDRATVTSDTLAAFSSTDRTIAVKTIVVPVKIDDKAAEEAKNVVDTMLAEPLTVVYRKKTWTFTPGEIAKLIDFRVAESSSETQTVTGTPGAARNGSYLEPFVSAAEASKTVPAKLGTGFGEPAVDAKFKTSNGNVTIIPSKSGVGPDIVLLATDMTTTLLREPGQERTVILETNTSEPKLTTEAARDMGIVERISTYTTTYGSNNLPRVNNIHTLGDALDGELVAPGATFSFNGAVGERTAAKGYQEAAAIVDGKLVPQLGGGICQVGTTLFNAIFLSGLPVKERHNHSFYISHYPKGRDATVSWGGPDLKFVNDTENWVMVSVAYSNSSITISLYGTDPGYEVTSKTGPFTNDKPFGTETTKDPRLGTGIKVIDENGITGRSCVVTRVVTKNGKIVRTDSFKSVYRPKKQLVRVGTKPVSSKNSTSTR